MADELDPPPTDEELAWATAWPSECACTGRCQEPPNFTCSGQSRAQDLIHRIQCVRQHPDLLRGIVPGPMPRGPL